MTSPAFDHDLGLTQRIQDLPSSSSSRTRKIEEVRQDIDHVDAVQLARDPDRQSFVGELVDDVEHPEPPPVAGALLDEVIGPHMITMHRPQPDARARRYGVSSLFASFSRKLAHRCANKRTAKAKPQGSP